MAFWFSSISLKSAFKSGSWTCDFLGKSTGDQFGVKPVGQPGVESVCAGLAVGGVEGTFDGDCSGIRECFGAACSFDVLVDNVLWILGVRAAGKDGQAKGGGYCELVGRHGVHR